MMNRNDIAAYTPTVRARLEQQAHETTMMLTSALAASAVILAAAVGTWMTIVSTI